MNIHRNPLIRILGYTQRHTAQMIGASLCSILNKICDLVPEILIGISIDVIVNQDQSLVSKLGISNPYYQLFLVGGITALFWIFESVFEYLYVINWRSLSQRVQHELRLKTYAHLQDNDLAYFENKTTGGLLAIVQDDINQLEQFFSQAPNHVIQLVVNVLVMGGIFLYLSPVLAGLALLPIPFVIGIAYYFQHKMARLYAIVRDVSGNLASHIAHRLHGIATIKSYTAEGYELERLRRESDRYQQAHNNANRVHAEYVPIVRMAVMVGFIMSLIVGGIYALQGTIPINWYAALVFLTQRFLWPFTELTTITDMYERSVASAQRILGILDCKPTIRDGDNRLLPQSYGGDITFQQVSFSYANGVQIFNDLNLTIPARTRVAFVGTTGSGKSTIIKLLLRFYDPNQGTILIDGHDIARLKLNDVRAAIGLVSQDAYLVDGTIADNISYGTFGASREEIIHAAQLAQAHHFIMSLPKGYDTVVQEYGKNISGGQRQRISIARALIKKAPILVFDEATSAVDNETEAALQQSIATLAAYHTIIIIAHRLTTVRNADIIFVLDKGTLIEAGNHETLLKKNGAYAHLWNIQH